MGFWDKLFGKKNKSVAETGKEEGRESGKDEIKRQETSQAVEASAAANKPEPPDAPVIVNDQLDTDASVIEQTSDENRKRPMAADQTPETAESPAVAEETHADEGTSFDIQKVEYKDNIQKIEYAVVPEAPTSYTGEHVYTADAKLQKRLDTYFARLREIYPDGVISHFNTGHKKLAERGAELRRLLEMDGDLDGFFALGGFTYQRSNGGRPPLPLSDEDEKVVINRIKTLFPEGVPVVMAIRDADHRLYLNLRALARRENMTVGEYLRENGCMNRGINEKEPVGVS